MKWQRKWTIAVALAAWIGAVSGGRAWAQPAGKGSKAPVRLLSSVQNIKPGDTFDVALAYEVADDWHIYWINPGESGAAPKVKWKLPPGFKVAELRFPVPRRYVSGPTDFRLTTYVLGGEPALLAAITAPVDLKPGGNIEISATVTTLVCKSTCLMEKAEVAVKLPVIAGDADGKPTHVDLFELARDQLPKPDGKGKHLKVTATPSVESIAVGGSFEVEVALKIVRGFHIQSSQPYQDYLIPTDVLVAPLDGIELGSLVYPPAHDRMDKATRSKISEYSGEVVVKIPIQKVNDDASGTSLTFHGIVKYQACNDKGQCAPPEGVAWSTTMGLTGAQTAQADASTGKSPDSDAQVDAAGSVEPDDEKPAAPGAIPAEEGSSSSGIASLSLPMMLAFAFLGGFILNVMPCVLPVISIKILSFIQQADEEPRRVFRLGLSFSTGILVSFWALAIFAVITKGASGASWGGQFSHPEFVIGMTALIFAFGMSLFGVFEVTLPGAASAKLSGATAKEGYPGAFLKGVLATLLATPCTAPLLAPAMAFAFTQSDAIIFLALTAVGVGMAFPYVLLTAKPGWMKFMPRPGAWMDSFKQFMGFVLMATVVWLLWILDALMDSGGVVATVAFLAFVGLACWLIGRIKLNWHLSTRLMTYAGGLGVALLGLWFSFGWLYEPGQKVPAMPIGRGQNPPAPTSPEWELEIPWRLLTANLQDDLAKEGYTVYVDFTAAWCATCQVNKKAVLERDAIRNLMHEMKIFPLKGDFTKKPDWMLAQMRRYGGNAVPLNVVIPANKPDQPIVLPIILTTGAVRSALEEAGPSEANPEARLAEAG